MADFQFTAQPRTDMGKRRMHRLRANGFIPGNLYGAHQDPETIALERNHVITTLKKDGIFSHILSLKIGGRTEKVVLKHVQRSPRKVGILHLDFQRINTKEKIKMRVPVHFLNEEKAPGVKDGGIVSHQLKEIEIWCLPADLPEHFEVNVGTLALDDVIHLSQIKMPQGVELADDISEDYDPIVVSIHEPKVSQEDLEEEQKAAELAAAAEGAEGAEAAATEEGAKQEPEKDGD